MPYEAPGPRLCTHKYRSARSSQSAAECGHPRNGKRSPAITLKVISHASVSRMYIYLCCISCIYIYTYIHITYIYTKIHTNERLNIWIKELHIDSLQAPILSYLWGTSGLNTCTHMLIEKQCRRTCANIVLCDIKTRSLQKSPVQRPNLSFW